MTWIENKPEPNDIPNAELCSLLTSQKVAFRTALTKYFYWNESSGASAGVPRLQTSYNPPGPARALFAPASQMSLGGVVQPGSLGVTSDTTRLLFFTSVSSVAQSNNVLQSATTVQASGSRWVAQTGITGILSATGTTHVVFPTNFGASPLLVQIMPYTSSRATDQYGASVLTFDNSGFTAAVYTGFGSISSVRLAWRSEGTADLTVDL